MPWWQLLLGCMSGKLMAMTVHYLPEILLEDCDKGREPIDIIKWFFQKNHPLNFSVFPYKLGIALLFGLSTLFFEVDVTLVFVLIVSCMLICCFVTDYQHGIIPDQFTLTLVWVGLIGSLNPIFVTPPQAIMGAVGGYAVFWAFNVIYYYFRKQDGMYPGDFKLNAGIGACVGFKFLIPILVISMVLVVVITLIQLLWSRKLVGSNFLSKEVPYACFVSVVMFGFIYLKLINF